MASLATMLILTNLAAMVSDIWSHVVVVLFPQVMRKSGLADTLDHFVLLGDNHAYLVRGVIGCAVFHIAAAVCLWRILVGIRQNKKVAMQIVSLLAFGCAAGRLLCLVWDLHFSFRLQRLAALHHRKLTGQIAVLHHLVVATSVQMMLSLLLAVLAYVAQARLKSGLVFTPSLKMQTKVHGVGSEGARTTSNVSSGCAGQSTAASSPQNGDDRRSNQGAPAMDVAGASEPVAADADLEAQGASASADLEAQGASDLVVGSVTV